jgi:glutamyl-tRNA(Gln) amidotransferase subunit D
MTEKYDKYNKRDDSRKVIADTEFEEKIALVKYYPGANFDIIDFYKEKGYRGLIIEATGLGHVGTEEAKYNWLPSIKSAIKDGMTICFAPQTFYGRLDPYVYAPGRELLEAGVIFLSDILPETAYVKLGWVLGHEKKPDRIKELMLKNIAGEFNPQIQEKSFLF